MRKLLSLLWRPFARLLRPLQPLWRRIRAPFTYLRRYYEPWMLSTLMLLALAAGITAWWLLLLIPDEPLLAPLARATPWFLGVFGLGLLALIGFAFWRPNARNPFTTPLFLRRFYRPWMLTVFSLVAIGLMGYGFWSLQARNPAAVLPTAARPDPSVSLRFEGVELRGRKQGTPFFTILADKVEVTRDNRYVRFLKGKGKPHGEFYNLKDWEEDPTGGEPKRRAITWESNEAEYDTVDQNLSMKGDVRIKTDLGDTIDTQEMLWNRNAETLVSNTRTRVHTHQDTYMFSNKIKVETKTKALFLEGQVLIDMKIGEDKIIDVEEFED